MYAARQCNRSPCTQKKPKQAEGVGVGGGLGITSQAELSDGICLILDSADLETPATQCQSQNLPHLPDHTSLVTP